MIRQYYLKVSLPQSKYDFHFDFPVSTSLRKVDYFYGYGFCLLQVENYCLLNSKPVIAVLDYCLMIAAVSNEILSGILHVVFSFIRA